MLNFSYSNPTRLVFGRDAELQVGAQTLAVLGGKAKVLVLFGGGSARRTGILDAVEKSLEDAGFCVIEKGGVQPNPRMGFVRETIDWVRDQGIRAIVAVGGGSVIDTAKAVAAGIEYEGDCWDLFEGRALAEKALPVLAVLTIPAAGSEQSIRCVITHHGTKAGIGAECLRPAAAFINPDRFKTLPALQIGAGVVDMFSIFLSAISPTPRIRNTRTARPRRRCAPLWSLAPGCLKSPTTTIPGVRSASRVRLPTTATLVSGARRTGPAMRSSMKFQDGTKASRMAAVLQW